MKKIISLIAALSMMISAASFVTVVQAAANPNFTVTVENVSDSTFSANTTFDIVVKYADVPTSKASRNVGVGLTAVQFELDLPGLGTTYDANWDADAQITNSLGVATLKVNDCDFNYDKCTFPYPWAGNVGASTSYRVGSGEIVKLHMVMLEDGDGALEFKIRTDADALVPKIETLKYELINNKVETTDATQYRFDGTDTPTFNDSLGKYVAKLDITNYPASTGGEKAAVQVNDAEGNAIFTDAAKAQAVAFYVELTDDAAGKTGKWYATFTDAEGKATAKKTNADITVPTFEGGSGRLGLIYKGTETVSAVSFKWN